MEELIHVDHRLHQKHDIRKFLKTVDDFKIVDIPIHPDNGYYEKNFVRNDLLQKSKDISDAVLLETAIRTHSTILTKDKHHIFTVNLENFLNEYNIKVFKELKEML